jgi:hypothetical protein
MAPRLMITLALLLALVGVTAHAATIANQQAATTAVGTTASTLTFAKAVLVMLVNDGPDPVYVRLDGTAATAAAPAFALQLGESLAPPQTVSRVSLICATGKSASVRSLAYEVAP